MEQLIKSTDKMNSLQIAEVTGKNHSDIMRAIRKMEESWLKIGQSNFALTSYIDSFKRAQPMYELTKTESLYIATKFKDEARAKLVLRWEELETEKHKPLSVLDIMQHSLNQHKKHEAELKLIKNEIKELKAKTTTRPSYFTIAGFGNLNGISVNLKLASSLGRKASKLCKERNLLTDTIPDSRFGKVKMYPKEILEEVFSKQTV